MSISEFENYPMDANPGYKVWMSGHSLGGSIVAMLAFLMRIEALQEVFSA